MRESHRNVKGGSVIHTMLRIGNIQLCQGEIEKALECFSEVSTNTTINNRYCIAFCRDLQNFHWQVLGIGYTDDSVNMVAVANAFYGRGCAQFCDFQLTDAMKSFNESLNWKLAALGENDPGLACIFYQMAHVHLQQSEPDEAITCLEEFVRLQKLDKQRNLQDNAEICFAEGIVARLNGKQENALSLYFQAHTMFETLFGENHEKVASVLVSPT
jgi:tetratricopeptide (TPR) repeat protein